MPRMSELLQSAGGPFGDLIFILEKHTVLEGAVKVHQQQCNSRRRQRAFSIIDVPYWNTIVFASSVETFKMRLAAKWHLPFPEVSHIPFQ